MSFSLMLIEDEKILKQYIKGCQDGDHHQQVAFSTYHNCLTQICFKCRVIRTTMKHEDALQKDSEVKG